MSRLGVDVVPLVLNLADYGGVYEFSWDSVTGASCRIIAEGRSVALSAVRSVWWRRPFGTDLAARWSTGSGRFDPTLAFILGVVGTLAYDAFLMNDPHHQFEADRKVLQLRVAAMVGFETPQTIITARHKDALRLEREVGRLIVKGHGGPDALAGTRLFDAQATGDLAVPQIFQRYLKAEFEHRVVFVRGRVFGGTFDISNLGDCPDIRAVTGLLPVRTRLPGPVEAMLAAYCARLGLTFAAFDLRESSGTFYFLEANPAGEWLYVDECNDWAITAAVAEALADGRRESAGPG